MKKHKIIILSIIAIIVLIIIAIGVFLYNKNNELVDVDSITTDSNYENIVYDEVENVWNEEVLGILSIEKIGLKATVRELTRNELLTEYIADIEDDSELGFKIENFAMTSNGGDEVKATFTCKDIVINDITQISTGTGTDTGTTDGNEANNTNSTNDTNMTSNTTNSTNSTNTTNTTNTAR